MTFLNMRGFMAHRPLRVGTRQSPLAMRQSLIVVEALKSIYPEIDVEVVGIKTSGDKITDRPLYNIGGKGLFVKELEWDLMQNKIDLAVHAMKDVEHTVASDFTFPCFLARDTPWDVLISRGHVKLADLPAGAKVGTCSPRRASQVLALRPDLVIVPMRGNVETRLRKLEDGQCDATLLALAGLQRLGLEDRITQTFDIETMVPAACQGVIGIECRSDDTGVQDLIKPLNHPETAETVMIERTFLQMLQGDCVTPVGVLARVESRDTFNLVAWLSHPESGNGVRQEITLTRSNYVDELRAWVDFLRDAVETATKCPSYA